MTICLICSVLMFSDSFIGKAISILSSTAHNADISRFAQSEERAAGEIGLHAFVSYSKFSINSEIDLKYLFFSIRCS